MISILRVGDEGYEVLIEEAFIEEEEWEIR